MKRLSFQRYDNRIFDIGRLRDERDRPLGFENKVDQLGRIAQSLFNRS